MSDKDFFFDEDDAEDSKPIEKAKAKEPAEAPAKKAASKSSAPKAVAERPVAAVAPVAPITMQPVSITVAALIGVVALLVGVIIGMFLPGQQPAATVTPGGPSAGMGGAPAPQLTEDQLQGGQLPPGHPPLDQMGGGAATPSPDATPAPGGTMPGAPAPDGSIPATP